MRNTKLVSLSRVKSFRLGIALALVTVVLVAAAPTAARADDIFVPGNASGFFGNPADQQNAMVAAITVTGPGTITVTYDSGLVTWDAAGDTTGPDGVACSSCKGAQTPLNEAQGLGLQDIDKVGALIGVFVPQSRVQRKGFGALDGTKDAPPDVGIMPGGVFFIGEGTQFDVKGAGTLYLGINDWQVGDNSGGFNVTVTGP